MPSDETESIAKAKNFFIMLLPNFFSVSRKSKLISNDDLQFMTH